MSDKVMDKDCDACKPQAPQGYRYQVQMRQSATTVHDISMVAVTENGDLLLVRPDGSVEDVFASGEWRRAQKKVGLDEK
jgi:hypothetical protein